MTHEKHMPMACTLRVCWEFRWDCKVELAKSSSRLCRETWAQTWLLWLLLVDVLWLNFIILKSNSQRWGDSCVCWKIHFTFRDVFGLLTCSRTVQSKNIPPEKCRHELLHFGVFTELRVFFFRRRSQWSDLHGLDVFSQQNNKQTCLGWRWWDRNKDTS
jgi:hypothetical protein